MKYIIPFMLSLFLISCGGDPAQNNAKAPSPSPAPAANPGAEGVDPLFVVKTPTVPTSYKRISQAPDPNRKLENPNITVEVEGLGSGKCSLIGIFTDQFYKADSTIANGGKIVFKNSEPYKPGLFYLLLPDQKTTIQMLIDADQTFTMKTKMTNLIGSMVVEGSKDNQFLYQTFKFDDAQKPKFQSISSRMRTAQKGTPEYAAIKAEQDKLVGERMDYLNKIFKENPTSLFTAFKEGGQNPVLDKVVRADGTEDNEAFMHEYRRLFWTNVNFHDVRLLYTPIVSNKLKRYMTELTGQNPDSIRVWASYLVDQTLDKPEFYKYFANWITLQYEPTKTTLMDSEAVFVHMIKNYFTYDRAFWSDSVEVHGLQLRAYEMSSSLIGQKGPNIQSPDPSGKIRSIYDMKANYVIVYMWNPTCEHCAEQTPQLVQLYHQWKPRGMDVYAIAVNTTDEEWKDGIKHYNMPWENNVFDPTNKSIYATYFVDNTPEIYVLNPDRTIIGKNLKVDQITTIIEKDMEKRGLK